MRSYDDDQELTRYVWHNYRHLMTQFERFGEKAAHAGEKASNSSESMARMIRAQWGAQNDPLVVKALEEGPEVFKRRVRDRILTESGNQVFINRCPVCKRVVATPKARQCLWCGQDWH